MLSGVPAMCDHTRMTRDTECTVLWVKSERGPSIFDRFRPRVLERRYELDEFGTFVVAQIDGSQSILDLVYAFESRFGMSCRESEMGVLAFLKILLQRHAITISEEAPAK